MSTLKVNNLQVGQDSTATNNLTWFQPGSPDGTIRLGSGNAGSATTKFTFDKDGNLTCVGNINAASILAPIEGTLDDWIVHAGDTNTKFGFPAADTFSVETAGQQNVQVNGTRTLLTSPSGTNTTLRLQHQGNSGYGDIILDRTVNAFIIDNDPNNAGSNGTYFSVKNKGTENLRITHDGKVGINQVSPDGMLHIWSATAGSVSADADADELVLENSGNVGLSLLTAGTGESSIYFGNPGTNGQKDAWIKYYHESHSTTANRRGLSFKTGGGSEKMKLDHAGRLLIGRESAYAHVDADNLIVGNEATNEHQGITILSHSGKYGGIYFGDGHNPNGHNRCKIIYDHPNDQFRIGTAGNSNQFYLDASGHMGLGISPSDVDSIGRALNIASSTGGAIYLQDTDAPTTKFAAISYNGGTAGLQIHAHHGSSYIDLGTNGTERLRINSSGKTILHGSGATGSNNTATILENGNTLNIHGTSSSDGISVVRYSANYGAYGINIGKSRNNTFGTNTLVQDGNELGHISFYGADGTDFEMAAQITGLVDGAPATGGDGTDMPGALSFRTTPEGSDSPTERLRITAAGNLKIPDNAKIELGGAQTGGGDLYIQHAPAGSGSDTIHSNSAYLYINSDALRLNSKTSGWNYLRGDKSDGVVKLYKSNSAKLSTSDTGITVTGEVAATQDYPDYRPTLDFNFAAVKKLDSRFRYYRLGGASYIDENGLVKFVSENQPRFDHDPVTREPKGLLIEQTRTNLLRYSHGDGFKSQGHMNDYTVGWVQQDTTNSTITPNAALGPDGTMSALKYTLNATSGRRLDYEEVDLDNSTTYCWSWWMKRMASNAVWSFQFVSGTSPTGDQILIDGVAASGQTTTYTPPDDKWHRVTWKFTTQANADEQDLGGYDSSGGTGDRWLLWGAQLEAGAFPTSLIPTRGNKATRGSEEIHMGSDRDGSSALDRTILNIFDDHEGTIVAEWETQESETNQNLISFHKDLSSAERVEIRATGSSTSNVRAEIVTGGSSTASIQVAHGGLQKNTKAAFGFQKDNYSLSVNGSAVSSDTSGNMPSDINSLMIGKGTWGTYFDGHLKRFMYYPKNLPDSQLITLTS